MSLSQALINDQRVSYRMVSLLGSQIYQCSMPVEVRSFSAIILPDLPIIHLFIVLPSIPPAGAWFLILLA